MSSFADHFSSCAGSYAAFRPSYPPELMRHLADFAPARDLAWDCATGNGQAAVLLAEHFSKVVASDASCEQVAHATPHPRVEYVVCTAEESVLADRSAGLVAVAQALHWFDLPRFYREVHRVLVPGGILAAWSYTRLEVSSDVRAIMRWFYVDRVGRYWPPERRHVESGYRDLDFPFEEIPAGTWFMRARWTRRDLLGYVGTWSAVEECRQREGNDPVVELEAALSQSWPDAAQAREVRWPLALRIGRNRREISS